MVRAKVKTKPTTPPTPVLAVALTPLAAFAEPVALGATITAVSGPPTVTLAYARASVTTIAMGPLAREIAVLPRTRPSWPVTVSAHIRWPRRISFSARGPGSC